MSAMSRPRRKPPADPQKFRVVVGPSTIDGQGAFAAEPIPARRKIGEIRGEPISVREARRRARDLARIMIVEVSERRAIDAARSTDPLRFTNHSCAPNAVLRIRQGRVEIYAMRDVAAGEELTVDYGESHHEGRLACRCGAPRCAGASRPRRPLPSEAHVRRLCRRPRQDSARRVRAKPARFQNAARSGAGSSRSCATAARPSVVAGSESSTWRAPPARRGGRPSRARASASSSGSICSGSMPSARRARSTQPAPRRRRAPAARRREHDEGEAGSATRARRASARRRVPTQRRIRRDARRRAGR